jgi:hypothetical protein
MMRSIGMMFACAALISTRAHAQGMISGAKAVAGRAAAASNAHTQAEQSPTATPPAATASTAAKTTPITSTAPATATTKPVATTTPPLAAAKTTPVAPAAAKTAPVPAATAAAKPATATTATTKAVAVTAKAAPGTKPAAAPTVTSDTGARSISVTQRGIKGEVSLNREVFSYDAGGRRDPFVSLLRNGDLRPMLNDLRLVTVLYDPTGRNSVAIMRDLAIKDQYYRVKVGQTLGRMRVAGIEPRQVLFTIEEIGFSRQEALAIGDSSRVRTQ